MRNASSLFVSIAAILIQINVASADPHTARPYAEYEPARTLIMSGHGSLFTLKSKQKLIANLPPEVTAVLYTTDEKNIAKLKRNFGGLRAQGQIQYVTLHSPGFNISLWSRDAIPVPVFSESDKLNLIGAHYHWNFEPADQVGNFLQTPVIHHNYFYEGGNFLADAHGNCFTVHEKRSDEIPESVFKNYYGCATLTRLNYVRGIGHVDEHIKFLSDSLAVTDIAEYQNLLESRGYHVALLPQGGLNYETYVNSLLVNGTLFMPTFREQARDDLAAKVYSDLGFKVVTLDSKIVSNFGFGSFHCMTMTYP